MECPFLQPAHFHFQFVAYFKDWGICQQAILRNLCLFQRLPNLKSFFNSKILTLSFSLYNYIVCLASLPFTFSSSHIIPLPSVSPDTLSTVSTTPTHPWGQLRLYLPAISPQTLTLRTCGDCELQLTQITSTSLSLFQGNTSRTEDEEQTRGIIIRI